TGVHLWLFRSWIVIFFFSSRRRHTRFSRDWSSDVCSSDLDAVRSVAVGRARGAGSVGSVRHPLHGPPEFDPHSASGQLGGPSAEIGRASCREREQIAVVVVTFKQKRLQILV